MQHSDTYATAILLAGYPDRYPTVFHRIQTMIGDMTVVLVTPVSPLPSPNHTGQSGTCTKDNDHPQEHLTVIVRNIEKDRLKRTNDSINEVYCPEDLVSLDVLNGNRNIAFAQAAVELLKTKSITHVRSDQMLPLLIADHLHRAGIKVDCDYDLGIMERRVKSDHEIEALHAAQKQTEAAIQYAFELLKGCGTVDGYLEYQGTLLTSEILRSELSLFLMKNGMLCAHGMITAGGATGADCHSSGAGILKANEPIILDVFPTHITNRYHGDCTRTFCPGIIPPRLAEMHKTVLEAKKAAIAVCKAGVTGAEVHKAVTDIFAHKGYHIGTIPALPAGDPEIIFYPHGTGHGIGLEVHEPPLLDEKSHEALIEGDVLTIEPALYCHAVGGVRIEDMVVVEANGCRNLNTLPESLWWE